MPKLAIPPVSQQLAEPHATCELHDTLLQNVIGLALCLEAATQKLSKNEPARPIFEAALEYVDEVLLGGCDEMPDMRVPDTAIGLPNALTSAGHELSQIHPVRFNAVTLGVPSALTTVVSDAVLHIAGEALLNAFRHAGATSIDLMLDYRELELRLSVHDDGCGIVAQGIAENGSPGHWGLAGMRERACAIDAELQIRSERGRGTRIELAVPAEIAYGCRSGGPHER